MTTMLKAYSGVPIPPVRRKTGSRIYPVSTMDIGQMFFVPERTQRAVVAYICRLTKGSDRKFSARNCWMLEKGGKLVEVDPGTPGAKEGVGVWRTK